MTYRDVYAFDCGTTNWRVFRLVCQEHARGASPISDPQRVGLTTFTDNRLPAALLLDEHRRLVAYGENAYELAQDVTLRPSLRDAFKLSIGNHQSVDPLHPQRRYTHVDALDYTRILLEQVIRRLGEERPGSLDGNALFFFTHPVHWGQELASGEVQGATLTEFAGIVRGCFPEPARDNVHFVAEPAAALVSLAQSGQLPRAGDAARLTLLVDVGGGTADFVAGRWTGAGFEDVRTYGEPLGGGVFDSALATYLAATLHVPEEQRAQAWTELRRYGRELKERLSQQMRMDPAQAIAMTITLKLDDPAGSPTFLSQKLRFGEKDFETSTAEHSAAFVQMTARALVSMNVASADVARVVLVGGGTNLYLVPQWISALVGPATPLIYGDPPEDVVARGAALWYARPGSSAEPGPLAEEGNQTMEKPTQLIDRADQVRQGMIALVDTLNAQATALELPKPPAALQRSRDKLAENAYTVLVVGEAKRGKSSFINALIGGELLPTDVDIATSQVFRVQPAEQEAYRLRFEDGSARAIAAADLPRYGSQVVADVQGTPRLDQIVRWIEVDIPIKFLPPGVTLLDTPGMGSLYAAHTQITQRFVPYADAVIYVLDSSQPLGQPDLDFVEQLLSVTTNLFFIQTKIDQHRKDAWQQIQQRNQALLAEHFGSRLPSAHVWPISNQNLLKAAQTGDEDYLAVSRQGELSEALQAFLFRVAGWYRAALAASVADRYFNQSRQTLAGRLAPLLDDVRGTASGWPREARQRQQRFDAEWGTQGNRRPELLRQVEHIAQDGRRTFEIALEPNGDIAQAITRRVDGLKNMKEALTLNESLAADISAETVRWWRDVCTSSETRSGECLQIFFAEAEQITVPEDIVAPGFPSSLPPEIRDDVMKKLGKALGKGGKFFMTVGSLPAPANPYAFGVVVIAWLGGSATAAGIGWKEGARENLVNAQDTMRQYIVDTVNKLRPYYFDIDFKSGQRCVVDRYFDSLYQAVVQQVEDLAARRSAEASAEADRLEAQANLDDQARQAQAEQARCDLAAWDQIGTTLAGLIHELDALDKATAAVA